MSLETKVKKLENETEDGDLADFLAALCAHYRPDIQPPWTFESYRGKSVREFFANAKVLRPKICEYPDFDSELNEPLLPTEYLDAASECK